MCDTQHSHSSNGRHRNRNQLTSHTIPTTQRQQSYKTEAEPLLSHRETESNSGSGKKNNAAEDVRTAGMGRGDSPRRTAGPRGGRKRRRRGRGGERLGFGPAQGTARYKGGRWSEGFFLAVGSYVLLACQLNCGRPMPRPAGHSNLAELALLAQRWSWTGPARPQKLFGENTEV